MKCKQMRRLLCIRGNCSRGAADPQFRRLQTSQRTRRLDGAGGADEGLAVDRHLAVCAGCSAFWLELQQMEATLHTRQAPVPPADLKVRISCRLSDAVNKEANAPWFPRLFTSLRWLKEDRTLLSRMSWTVSVGAMFALGTVSLIQQSGRANTALKRMGEAARNVRTVHILGWNCELRPEVAKAVKQGEESISVIDVLPRRVEAWISGDKLREAEDYDVTVVSKSSITRNGETAPAGTNPPLLTGYALRAISGGAPFGMGVPYKTEAMGETVWGGKRLVTLSIESQRTAHVNGEAPINEKRLFWLDPDTYLPVRMEEMRRDIDRWALAAVIWFDYNIPVSDALFDPVAVKAERHSPIDWSDHPARDLYRLSPEQSAQYQTILNEPDAGSSPTQQDANPQVARSKELNDRLRHILTEDQRRLFDDWWYIQPKILDKLATPATRAAEAGWRAQQQKELDEFYSTSGTPMHTPKYNTN